MRSGSIELPAQSFQFLSSLCANALFASIKPTETTIGNTFGLMRAGHSF